MLQEKITQPLRRVIQHPTAAAVLSQASDPRVDLKELIRIIKRRRASILGIAAVPAVLTLLYCLVATPLYTTSTQLLIDPRDRRIVSNEVSPEALAAFHERLEHALCFAHERDAEHGGVPAQRVRLMPLVKRSRFAAELALVGVVADREVVDAIAGLE